MPKGLHIYIYLIMYLYAKLQIIYFINVIQRKKHPDN